MAVAASKTCEHCGRLYAPGSNRQRFCSAPCVVLAHVKVGPNGCWIWTGSFLKNGYGAAGIGKLKTTAHKLSYIAFVSPVSDGAMFVCHKCDIRACVNPNHLFLGTQFDNMSDCAKKGRNVRKLTEKDVIEIRSAVGVSKAELGRRYGVTDAMIGKIIRNEWWKDVARIETQLPLPSVSKSHIS